jgi:hypothetical protein
MSASGIVWSGRLATALGRGRSSVGATRNASEGRIPALRRSHCKGKNAQIADAPGPPGERAKSDPKRSLLMGEVDVAIGGIPGGRTRPYLDDHPRLVPRKLFE